MNTVQEFANDIYTACRRAYASGQQSPVQLMPIPVREAERGCIIRFKIGTAY